MKEIDVWRAAQKMIEMYELDASWNAGLRADHLLDQGDLAGFNVWVKIARTIQQLQQQKQPGEVLRH